MIERKQPPPMYAVWNETLCHYVGPADSSKRIAIGVLYDCESRFPKSKFLLITLIPQPEPPQ